MTNMDCRLNCIDCGRFTEYTVEQTRADRSLLVRCAECDKRHGEDSIMFVDLHRTYPRDESGRLAEEVTF
jgi:uncharacterized Zn finger protein